MATQVSSVEFFKQYVVKEITKEQFVENLQKLTTELQQHRVLSSDQQELMAKTADQLDDELISHNIELILKFSLHLANRGIYKQLVDRNFDFNHPFNHDPINLPLYLVGRVHRCESPKVLLIFLNGVIRDIKQIEKKLLLLEMYIAFLAGLERRDLHYQDILPLILKVINDGLQKYYVYVKMQKDGDFSDKNQFVHDYYTHFQEWTASILQRIFINLRKTPEITTLSKQKAIQDLMTINDLYDYDPVQDQVFKKPENPNLAVKHLVLLFLFDLIQGILEAKLQASNVHLDVGLLNDLLKQIEQFLEEIHSNKVELIENYLQTLKFHIQRHQPLERKIHRYDLELLYNPVSMVYLAQQALFQNKQESHNVSSISSVEQILKVSFGVLYEQKFLIEMKNEMVDNLLGSLAQLLSKSQLQFTIASPTYFITRLDVIVLKLVEKAGSGLSKEDEQMYLSAWKNLMRASTLECHAAVVSCSIASSDNIELLSHLIHHFRNSLAASIKEGKQTLEDSLKYVNQIYKEVKRKAEVGTIDTKIQIVDGVILLLKSVCLNAQQKAATIQALTFFFDLWKQGLQHFEKGIQQSLDYLNGKKKQKEQQEQLDGQSDQAYYQLLHQENVLQITYYNLQDLTSLWKQISSE